MGRPRHTSRQIDALLGALADDPAHWTFGYELSKRLGIGSGTLYPALIRLSADGLLEQRWEAIEGRPQRHLYRLSAAGIARAHAIAARPATARGTPGRALGEGAR